MGNFLKSSFKTLLLIAALFSTFTTRAWERDAANGNMMAEDSEEEGISYWDEDFEDINSSSEDSKDAPLLGDENRRALTSTQQHPDSNTFSNSNSIIHLRVVGFNESCKESEVCALHDHLICSASDGSGRCSCLPDTVYVRQERSCWNIPRSGEDECNFDVQCHAGKWGSVSRCNKHHGRCECYDYSTDGMRDTMIVDGVCYVKKSVGHVCKFDSECDLTISGGAYCLPNYNNVDRARYNGTCQCKDGSMWYEHLSKCLQLSVQVNDSCVISDQCRKGSLGEHSICDMKTSQCLCWTGHGSLETVYFENQCFLKKGCNDTCDTELECRASLGPEVQCDFVESQPPVEEKLCRCPNSPKIIVSDLVNSAGIGLISTGDEASSTSGAFSTLLDFRWLWNVLLFLYLSTTSKLSQNEPCM